MSNFKKTLIYSTTVLSAGLLAVFAISGSVKASGNIITQNPDGTFSVNTGAVLNSVNNSVSATGTGGAYNQPSQADQVRNAARGISPAPPGYYDSGLGQWGIPYNPGMNNYDRANQSIQSNTAGIVSGIQSRLPTAADIRARAEQEIATGVYQTPAQRKAMVDQIQAPMTAAENAAITDVRTRVNQDTQTTSTPVIADLNATVGQDIRQEASAVANNANSNVSIVDSSGNIYDSNGVLLGQDSGAAAAISDELARLQQEANDTAAVAAQAQSASNAANNVLNNALQAQANAQSTSNAANAALNTAILAEQTAATNLTNAQNAQIAAINTAVQVATDTAAAQADLTAAQASGIAADIATADTAFNDALAAQAAADAAVVSANTAVTQAQADLASAQAQVPIAQQAAVDAAQDLAQAQAAVPPAQQAADIAAAEAAAAQVVADQAQATLNEVGQATSL